MRSRTSSTLAVIIVVVFVTLGQTTALASSPITNRASPVPGRANGELYTTDLIKVTPSCMVLREAATSLSLLLASARQRGITLSPNSCYRSVSGQVAALANQTSLGTPQCAASLATNPDGTVRGTSMHGWGKAVDFGFGGGSFGSAGYAYLKKVAGAYGWMHPAFAEPGGSCPEAWHWEWVGDGGALGLDTVKADVVGLLPGVGDGGYAKVTGLGGLTTFGNAVHRGAAAGLPLSWVMVGAASTPDRSGYWMVGADGGVFSFGSAGFYGSTGATPLHKPIVGMTPTPSGRGYWMVAADGGVFAYGDARFHGSTGSIRLNRPVVSMASTPDGGGYWLIASDGGIFAFGNAPFLGSTGSVTLHQPVVGGAGSPGGGGYWLVASDGGVFAFGNAPFLGSSGARPPAQPVVAMTPTRSGTGYWLTVANGEVRSYGSAGAFG
jgi:hypothetical protein